MSKLKKFVNQRGHSPQFLYRDEITNKFWCVVRIGKGIRKKCLETTELVEASIALPKALQDLNSGVRVKGRTVVRLVKDFRADLMKEKRAEQLSEATLLRIDIIWKYHLEPYWGNVAPAQIHANMMPDFVLWHRRERGTQLVNVYKHLSNIFNFMHRAGAIQISQIPRLTLPKNEIKHHDTKKGRIVTPDEFQRLVENSVSDRTRLWIRMAYFLGFRKMEIGKLEASRVVRDHGRLFVVLGTEDTKTGLARTVPLPLDVASDLENFVSGSKYLFQMASAERPLSSQLMDKEWTATKIKAGIKGRLRFHDLRHTAATNMAIQKVNPIMACTILGMNIQTYQKKYLKLSGFDLISVVDDFTDGVKA